MNKHLLKLINNERTNVRIASKKGYYGNCPNGADDWCATKNEDLAFCSNYAYDHCSVKDRAACSDGADDICTIDLESDYCQDPGTRDIS